MLTLFHGYNLRSLRARWRTTLASALGVGLVVFVLAASLMLQEGIRHAMGTAGSAERAVVLRQGSENALSSVITDADLAHLRTLPGIARTPTGDVLATGELVSIKAFSRVGSDQAGNVTLRGFTDASLALRPELHVVEGRRPRPGVDEVMIGRAIAGRFEGLQLGAAFPLTEGRPIAVVGVFEAGGSALESEVWGDLEILRTALGRPAAVSSALLQLEDPARLPGLQAAADEHAQLSISITREDELQVQQSEGTLTFLGGLGLGIAALSSIGAMLGASITMHAAVDHRRKEIGVLRALGFTRRTILACFLGEALAVALVGGLLGSLAALGLGSVELTVMNLVSWSQLVFQLRPTPAIVAIATGCGGLMGLVGGLVPAIGAARTVPTVALRS